MVKKLDKIEQFGTYSNRMIVCGSRIRIYTTCNPYGETIDGYISMLEEHKSWAEDIVIELEQDNYDTSYSVHLSGWREMTQAELKKVEKYRKEEVIKQEQYKVQKEANEAKEYERLKKKFDG